MIAMDFMGLYRLIVYRYTCNKFNENMKPSEMESHYSRQYSLPSDLEPRKNDLELDL